jgi:hypothetical protein
MAREVISGVGKNARRTDMNISEKTTQPMRYMSGGTYGEGQEMLDLQGQAQMQGSVVDGSSISLPKPQGGVQAILPREKAIPLTAETQRLDEAPETGMSFGPGAGPEVLLGQNPQTRRLSDQVYPAIALDPSGDTQAFYDFLIERGL